MDEAQSYTPANSNKSNSTTQQTNQLGALSSQNTAGNISVIGDITSVPGLLVRGSAPNNLIPPFSLTPTNFAANPHLLNSAESGLLDQSGSNLPNYLNPSQVSPSLLFNVPQMMSVNHLSTGIPQYYNSGE
jgi:hypothetical protein